MSDQNKRRPYRLEEDEGWAEDASPAQIVSLIASKNDHIAQLEEELSRRTLERDHANDCADAAISAAKDLEGKLSSFTCVFGEDFPEDDIAWLAPFISRFTLDEGRDADPEVHISLLNSLGKDKWIVQIGSELLNNNGDLEEDRWYKTDDWNPMFQEDIDRVTSDLKGAFERASAWMEARADLDVGP